MGAGRAVDQPPGRGWCSPCRPEAGMVVAANVGSGIEIGRGTTARVFAMRDAEGRAFALKIMKGDDRDARRARRECAALGRLDHPFIPRLLGAGRSGRQFLATELMRG